MKKNEVKVGGLYIARVSGKFVTVRVDEIREIEAPRYGFRAAGNNGERAVTLYDITNLTTGCKTTFRSAAKFRLEVQKETKQLPFVVTSIEDLPAHQTTNGAKPASCGQTEAQVGVCTEENKEANSAGNMEDEQRPDPIATGVQVLECANGAEEGVIVSGLAAKIAAQSTPVATDLTQQQQDILNAAKEIESNNGQRVLVIGAGAGTGKTFTLKQLEQVLQGNGQYTAFNSSLVAESKSKFKRVACNTTHSLAFRAVGCQFKHRLGGPRVRSWQVANQLGITDQVIELSEAVAPYEDGKPQVRTLKAAFLAGQVTQAIKRFCQSADLSLTVNHFNRLDGIDDPGKCDNSNRVKDYLLPHAKTAWADLTKKDGTLPFSHDVYVKLWEMGQGNDRPVIAADYILLDEAQDTSPVMLSILQQQTHALLILVGDDNQQIYEWRGAVNAMASFRGAPRRLLSKSFRFGTVVADVANTILATLEQPTDLIMQGHPGIPSRVCPVAEPRCYLYRTNAGAIGKLLHSMDEGKRGHLIGGSQEAVSFCRAALELQAGKGTNHSELGCFQTWSEVQHYVNEDEGADLKLMVKLIDDFGADRIIMALDNMPSEDRADLVISTAHRSKGREWASVQLGQDFKTADKLDDSERRLLYVACTRAQQELDLTRCPTFCGGMSKSGGENGDTGTRFVPGLKITYTAPMPTADDLAAYRAEKSAHVCPKIAPESANGILLASPTPDAAEINVNQTNSIPVAHAKPENEASDNTWARSKYNDWVVRGKPGQSGTITVTRKNGTTSQETIKRTIWKDEAKGVALYEV